VAHLFFVLVALSASYGRSELTGRILEKFSFYTRLLNLELNLNFAPYYLTHATEADVDHQIEVLGPGKDGDGEWIRLREEGVRWSEGYRRYQRLARYMSLLGDDDASAARLAASIGEHFARVRSISPQQLRCRRHLLQDWETLESGTVEERNPSSEIYFRTPYAANCVVSTDGHVSVMKVESNSQVASPSGSLQSDDR
jgi:hypothetical protein